MPRLTPVSWKVLESIFLKDGFVFEGQVGSHRTYSKQGIARPVVIPSHKKPVSINAIISNMKTAGMSRDRFFELLDLCK
jgi:predicted RNA binding protein YcfA (HicA-like mRNA interferase family)